MASNVWVGKCRPCSSNGNTSETIHTSTQQPPPSPSIPLAGCPLVALWPFWVAGLAGWLQPGSGLTRMLRWCCCGPLLAWDMTNTWLNVRAASCFAGGAWGSVREGAGAHL